MTADYRLVPGQREASVGLPPLGLDLGPEPHGQ